MPFGIIDTKYVDLPAGIDDAYLRGLETRSGLSVAQMVQDLDSALATINEGADPLVAALTAVTSNPVGAVRGTSTKKIGRAGEFTVARPQQSSRAGHMLPIAKIEMGLGFTEDGLEEISQDAYHQELDDMVMGFQRYYLAEALGRLFKSNEVPVDQNTSVVSPGFAGSGTGNNVFTGVYPDGSDLGGGYTHYHYSSPANLMTAINTAMAKLEKWHTAPFDLVGSSAFITDLITQAGTNFVYAGSPLIRPAQGTAEALVDPGDYIGVLLGKIRVRQAYAGIGSTKHGAIFKSYGAFDARNPLAWRYDAMRGRDAFVRSRHIFPLVDAVALQWLGFGANDRAGAALFFVDTAPGAYVDPTITIV